MDTQSGYALVVIVEDNDSNAELLRVVVEQVLGWYAVVVKNGDKAFDTIRSLRPSLVLMDIVLTGMSGLDVHELMCQDATTRDIPVLFVSASQKAYDMEKLGVPNVVTKPFCLEDLLARVTKLCKPGIESLCPECSSLAHKTIPGPHRSYRRKKKGADVSQVH